MLTGIATVLDSLTAAAVVVDERGDVVATNRVWDATRSQAAGTIELEPAPDQPPVTPYATLCEAADPEDALRIGEGIRSVLTGEAATFEHTFRCPSGGQGWGSVQVTPIVGANLPRLALVLHTDVTRERATAEALDIAESRMRAVFEGAGIAIGVVDLKGRAVDVNPSFCDLFGYRRDELVGQDLRLVLEAKGDVADWGFSDLLSGQRDVVRSEGRCVRRDKSVIWARFTSSAVRDDLGRLRYIVGTIEDISADRLSSQALQVSEERLRTLVEACPAAIVETDTERRIRTWNPAAERMFGWRADEVLGQILPINGPDAVEVGARWDWVLQGNTGAGIETTHFDKSGRPVDLSLSIAPTRGDDGEVTGIIGVMLDVTERKRIEQQLAHSALHDDLTGLPNRALLLDRISLAMARARRAGSVVALLLCDLDRFQLVNDSLGHPTGDRLLAEIGRRLTATVRTGDTVARLGGDEFAVLCEDLTSADDAVTMAGRLAAAAGAPFSLDEHDLVPSMSIGITVSDGTEEEPEALLRDADATLFQAKTRGRNRYEIFNASTRTKAVARLDMESQLRRALTENQLAVYYQPIIQLDSGRVVGAEALARWHHPSGEIISPNDFIPVAEETGLIVPIGAWVLREAASQAALWRDLLGRHAPYVSVNLSARQLLDPHLCPMISDVLRETRLDPALLCLEITESVLMEDVEASAEALAGLRKLVPRLLVDDFGTGYSSLAYLRSFPLDGLKLDRSFVDGAGRSAEHQVIPAAVASLGTALCLDTLAEGVETVEELDLVQNMGYQLGQGFLWSHPLPADAMRTWLLAHRS